VPTAGPVEEIQKKVITLQELEGYSWAWKKKSAWYDGANQVIIFQNLRTEF